MPESSIGLERESRRSSRKRERRVLVRYACTQTGSCSVFPSYERFRARVRNISAGGIGFVTTREFKPDTLLMVELVRGDGTSRGISARVTHSLKLAETCWSIGCEFDRPLSQETLHALV